MVIDMVKGGERVMEGIREMVIEVGEGLDLEKAVCNHGFFMMAPNKWIPSQKCLQRPILSQPSNIPLNISITQPNSNDILITLSEKPLQQLSPEDQQSIRSQVGRMLRIDEHMMVSEFHQLHPGAKQSGFARIFRSPTLFEDIIKSILLCNCGWGRSLEMAEALCNLGYKIQYEKQKKRKRKRNKSYYIFPSAKEIASCMDEETLNKHCNLGFRASYVLGIAKKMESGRLKLEDLQTPDPNAPNYEAATAEHETLRNRLKSIKGFGSFTVANVMMCIGFYQYIPLDTETIKHLQRVHGKTELNSKSKKCEIEKILEEIYDKYAPFQCLVYWMEHIEYYEKYVGKLSQLPPSKYCTVTSSNFQFNHAQPQQYY